MTIEVMCVQQCRTSSRLRIRDVCHEMNVIICVLLFSCQRIGASSLPALLFPPNCEPRLAVQHDQYFAPNYMGDVCGSDVSDEWILVPDLRRQHAFELSNDVIQGDGAAQHSVQYSWRQTVALRDQLQLKLRPPQTFWRVQQTTRRWRQFVIRLLVRQRLPRATSRASFLFWEGVLEDFLGDF